MIVADVGEFVLHDQVVLCGGKKCGWVVFLCH